MLNLPETNPSRWLTWYDWFGAQRIILDNSVASLTFNAYSLLIEATLKGKGVALGWMPLVGQLLDEGELVIPCGPEVKTERGYYSIQSQRDSESRLYHRVKEWLINESFSCKSRHESYFQPQDELNYFVISQTIKFYWRGIISYTVSSVTRITHFYKCMLDV